MKAKSPAPGSIKEKERKTPQKLVVTNKNKKKDNDFLVYNMPQSFET